MATVGQTVSFRSCWFRFEAGTLAITNCRKSVLFADQNAGIEIQSSGVKVKDVTRIVM